MTGADHSWSELGFVLDDWEVRPRHGTLRRRSAAPPPDPIQVEPRVMAVLVCLARHAGQVVTRDEFIAEVWGGRVVSDEALSRCVSLLRQVLDDDSREPRFIRTVARIGYTLLKTPQLLADEALMATRPPSPPQEPRRSPARVPRSLVLAGILCLAVAAAVLLYYWLRATRPDAGAPAARLLVLPFDNSTAGDFGRVVGDELADEIANSLARVARLRISGRTSAYALAAMGVDAAEAGRRVGVDAVLDGTVADSPQGLRVSARLTATRDARVLWSEVYERRAADIFAVQSSIASAVARELVRVPGQEPPPAVSSVEPESRDLQAYQLYLRGAHQVRLRGEDSLRLAVELFSAAARRDPTYARAQLGLASAYALLPSYTFENPADMYALADRALDSAERLSHSRSVSAGTRGYLDFMRRKWLDAESSFRTALAVDPNNPDVRQMYSQLLGAVGRLDAALIQAQLAQELDPLAPVIADRIGALHLWLGHDAEAARDVALARELGLEEAAYPEIRILLKLHQHADADAAVALRTLQRTVNRPDSWIAPTLDAYRHPQGRAAVIELLDRAQKSGAISARIYFGAMVLLESPQRAMAAFAALHDADANDLEFLFSVDAAAVRRDPAFGDFVRRTGLEAYWERFGWPPACRREHARIVCL